MIEITRLGPGDEQVLRTVGEDVFDGPVRPDLTAAMLADPRHHLVVARDGDLVVGFASGVDYLHPDKPAQMFVNEVGVAPHYRRRGIAQRLLSVLFEHATAIGCTEAWVLTEPDNEPANALYADFAEAPATTVMYTMRLVSERG